MLMLSRLLYLTYLVTVAGLFIVFYDKHYWFDSRLYISNCRTIIKTMWWNLKNNNNRNNNYPGIYLNLLWEDFTSQQVETIYRTQTKAVKQNKSDTEVHFLSDLLPVASQISRFSAQTPPVSSPHVGWGVTVSITQMPLRLSSPSDLHTSR